jgi:undecaprenyl diphosphate synthase
MPQPPIDPQSEFGLTRDQLPRHIAIIMDGNGRWANARGLPRINGHMEGAANVRSIITHCARLKLEALTLYSFSAENWKRPRSEIDALMALYVEYLIKEREEMMDNGVRLLQVGRREGLPESVLRELDISIELTRGNEGLKLCLAINYGSRQEIVDAVRSIARDVAAGAVQPADIDESHIADRLYTAGIPDPDLLIRTAGQMRISNFLLWQISYSELCVTDVLWPDFRPEHLNEALRDYAGRQRRFGAVLSDVAPPSA